MISAAEAKEASQSVDYITVATFMDAVEPRIRRAVALGKRNARIGEMVDVSLSEHLEAQSPTFLMFVDQLKDLGYTVKHIRGMVPHMDISW